MNRRSAIFLSGFALLLGLMTALLMDGLRGHPVPELELLSRVTTLPGPAFATGHLEGPRPPFRDHSEIVHPALPPLNQLDQVYAPR